MLMILPILTLLSITEVTYTAVSPSNFALELRNEIANALNEGINTSGIQEVQCVVESK